MAKYQSLHVFEGNDRELGVSVTRDGAALNLTGWSADFTARKHADDLTPAFTYTVADAEVVIDNAVGGHLVVRMAAADMVAGSYAYHLDIIKPDGDRETVLYGPLVVGNL